jgi:RNA polymerase sigma-70 factor (ECF subfamily)
MAAVARGDREAFAALYERHAPALMRFLYRLSGDRALAEDLLQDAFLRVWRAAGSWRPEGKVTTWLYTIAKRHGWNVTARDRRRRATALPEDARPAGSEHAASDRASIAEEARRAGEAVADLPAALRLVFVLVRLEGTSLAEAAEVADVPVGTVKSRLAAAEESLRRRLRT